VRISLIGMTTFPSPPFSYGGEAATWSLACGLSALHHEVFLYAAPGSKVPPEGKLRYIPGTYGEIDLSAEAKVMELYREEVLASDLIIDMSHNKLPSEEIYWYHRQATKKTVLIPNGVHGHIPRCPKYNLILGSRKWKELVIYGRSQFYDNPLLASVWGRSFEPTPEKAIVGVFPWGTDTSFYTPDGEREDWWLWLGRPTPNKGFAEALWLAAKKKLHLKCVVGLGMESHRIELEGQMPLVEEARNAGAKVEVITIPQGFRHHEIKREYYRKAKAMVQFLTSHEPFGLVMIEALSCGCPVISSTKGAVPEILEDGKTGFLCETKAGMLEAADRIGEIVPDTCRREAVKRFDAQVWAQNIVNLLPELEEETNPIGRRD